MRILTTICTAVIAICGTGFAQSSPDLFTVHFATPVLAGGAMLPAGDCSIQVLHGSSDNVVLAIRSASGVHSESGTATSVLVQVNRLNDTDDVANGHVTVVLSRRDNGYQLDQILLPDHNGYQVLD